MLPSYMSCRSLTATCGLALPIPYWPDFAEVSSSMYSFLGLRFVFAELDTVLPGQR